MPDPANPYGTQSIYLEQRNALAEAGVSQAQLQAYSSRAATRYGAPLFNPANAEWAAGLNGPSGTITAVAPQGGEATPAQSPLTNVSEPYRGTIPRANPINPNEPGAGMFNPQAPGGSQAQNLFRLPSLPALPNFTDWALRIGAFLLALILIAFAIYMMARDGKNG